MKTVNTVALVLVVVGALNWGLVGVLGFNLVEAIFGAMSMLTKIVYILVGVSAILVAMKLPMMMKQ